MRKFAMLMKTRIFIKNILRKTKIMVILRTYDFSVSLWVHRSPVTKVHTLLCMNLWQQMPCEKQHEYPFFMKHRHAKSVKSSTSTWYYGKVWVTLVFTSAAFKSIFKSNNLVIQKVWRTDAAPKKHFSFNVWIIIHIYYAWLLPDAEKDKTLLLITFVYSGSINKAYLG